MMIYTVLVIILLIIGLFLSLKTISQYDNPRLFSLFVRQYSRHDRKNFPDPDPILCTGSSVMKFWKSVEEDLSPLYVLNRGIPGTKINEIAYWADKLVIQYKPKAVVLYAGSNDIQGKRPRTAEQVLDGFNNFCHKIHRSIPDLPVIYISITPSPAKIRLRHQDEINKANSLIKEHCESNHLLTFCDVSQAFLDARGLPDKALFKRDKIHFNEKGYQIWTSALKPILEKI